MLKSSHEIIDLHHHRMDRWVAPLDPSHPVGQKHPTGLSGIGSGLNRFSLASGNPSIHRGYPFPTNRRAIGMECHPSGFIPTASGNPRFYLTRKRELV